MKRSQLIAIGLLVVFVLPIGAYFFKSCEKPHTSAEATTDEAPLAAAPAFNADSAYAYVQKQVDFGPRVPNSAAHRACGDWLIAKLKQFGAEVTVQSFTAKAYNGTSLQARNIIGSINPTASKRILLAAHWDTRPFADKDSTTYQKKPFDAANDGASGIGVLLELVRTIQANVQKPNVGVDVIFFDVEDYGAPENSNDDPSGKFWCLGSQYWVKNLHKPNYSAYFGILLDMVGGKNAHFTKEGTSMMYAGEVTNQIWKIASKLGYNTFFIDQETGGITDDHSAVNEIAKIPMVDIIEYNTTHPDKVFGDYHHTHLDNMQLIDRPTLKAVGQTVLQVLYQQE
ncbi:MAG: M28 family peptidase [Spirosomataceae bacterium]